MFHGRLEIHLRGLKTTRASMFAGKKRFFMVGVQVRAPGPAGARARAGAGAGPGRGGPGLSGGVVVGTGGRKVKGARARRAWRLGCGAGAAGPAAQACTAGAARAGESRGLCPCHRGGRWDGLRRRRGGAGGRSGLCV
jgi:hypothetical protein